MSFLATPVWNNCRLEVLFRRVADRYQQVVSLYEGDVHVPLWESCEGDANQIWPASPPLQQCHLERREAGDVALLVGMSGRNHWSLSVSTLSGLSPADEPTGFEWDVACRIQASPDGHPRSTYRMLAAAQVPPQGEPGTSAVLISGNSWQVRLAASATVACGWRFEPPTSLEFAPRDLSGRTCRWRYRLLLESPGHAV